MKTILLLNGPNLNLLGQRQPEIYGHETLADVETLAQAACAEGFAIDARQSNWEGQLIDWLHEAHRVRARAVLRTAHSSSVLSAQCSLGEYGVPLWGLDLEETHLTRTDGQPGRREAGVVAGLFRGCAGRSRPARR